MPPRGVTSVSVPACVAPARVATGCPDIARRHVGVSPRRVTPALRHVGVSARHVRVQAPGKASAGARDRRC